MAAGSRPSAFRRHSLATRRAVRLVSEPLGSSLPAPSYEGRGFQSLDRFHCSVVNLHGLQVLLVLRDLAPGFRALYGPDFPFIINTTPPSIVWVFRGSHPDCEVAHKLFPDVGGPRLLAHR